MRQMNKKDYIRYGVDISRYNSIDWDLMASENVDDKPDFIMIKAGGADANEKYTDRDFYFHARKADQLGIPYGVYYVCNVEQSFYTIAIESAVKEAEHFRELLKTVKPKYPVAIDVEISPKHRFISSILRDKVYLLCKFMESAGYYTLLYSSANEFRTTLKCKALREIGWWVGAWSSKEEDEINAFTERPENAQIWQYSSTGSRYFSNGDIDLDASYLDFEKIIRDNKLNHLA